MGVPDFGIFFRVVTVSFFISGITILALIGWAIYGALKLSGIL